jgi:hypothetical protein
MSSTDVTPSPADEGQSVEDIQATLTGLTDDDLLEQVRALSAEAEPLERQLRGIFDRRMAFYLELKARKVLFALVDEASGNRPGATRAAIGKYLARQRRTTAATNGS